MTRGQGGTVTVTTVLRVRRLPEPYGQSNNHHTQEPRQYPEAGLAGEGFDPVEHLENQEALALHSTVRAVPLCLSFQNCPARDRKAAPADTSTCRPIGRGGAGCHLLFVYRGSSCMEYCEVSHLSPAKCRDIACRAGTFLSRRRPGPIGHGIASRQKLPRASLTLPARTNAPQSVGWLASSSRRRPSWPCWSPGFSQNPNPAPVIGLSKWTQHQTMKGNPQG